MPIIFMCSLPFWSFRMDFENVSSGISQTFDALKNKVSSIADEITEKIEETIDGEGESEQKTSTATETDTNIFPAPVENETNSDEFNLVQSDNSVTQNQEQIVNKDIAVQETEIEQVNEETNQSSFSDTIKNAGNKILDYTLRLALDCLCVGDIKNICGVDKIENKYGIINFVNHGMRLDDSLDDYKIKAGDKEIQIHTDNNIVSEEWAKRNGIPVNGSVLTDEKKQAIEEAVELLQNSGQIIPEHIFISDLFTEEKKNVTAGIFSYKNNTSIFLNSKCATDKEFFKNTVLHESAHMADYKFGNKQSLSNEKGINVNDNNYSVDFDGITIQKDTIKRLISDYALTNNQEFVAEVSLMINKGQITQDENGNYKINTTNGYFHNAHLYRSYFDNEKDTEALNDIMKLYNHLTEGKITAPKVTNETEPDNYTRIRDYNANIKNTAEEFYRIAYNNYGNTSIYEMQLFFNKNISQSNIVDFLDYYNSEQIRRGDSSIIDTITSEVEVGNEYKRKLLMSVINTLGAAAAANGVSKADIQKAKDDFTTSLDKELNSFGRINPSDMEKAVDFLRGSIAAGENLKNYEYYSNRDAIKFFKTSLISEQEMAKNNFELLKNSFDISKIVYDKIFGLFGCTTIDDLEKKLGENSQSVKKLLNSNDENEFKENYKEIFGIEFDERKILAVEIANFKYNLAKENFNVIQKIDDLINGNKSYTELKDILINDFQIQNIDEIIEANKTDSKKQELNDEEKKEAIIKFLKRNNEKFKKNFDNEMNGKSIEQLKKDIELITKSTFGTNDILKDINNLNY